MTAKLSLEVIQVRSPCEIPWASMSGDDRVRHCSLCKQDVYNLAAMRRDDAEELLSRAQGRLCIRIARRADGTVVTDDCEPARMKALRRSARKTLIAAGAFAGTMAAMLGGVGWLLSSEPLCSRATTAQSWSERLTTALVHKVDAPRYDYVVGDGG
jgi:hypothetical protein